MKTSHKWNGWAPDRTDPVWAERVEREAERTTNQAEVRWNKAQRRLARATEKHEAALRNPQISAAKLDTLWLIVEARRAELHALERLAQQSPAGSQHRGRGSHRGVGTGEAS